MQRQAQTDGRGNSRLITSYRDFAAALTAEGILSDPWVDGAPRFRMTPVWLDRATQGALYDAASGVAAVHAEAARLCAIEPSLLARFFDLPPAYELMWRMSAPAWHGIARADVFLTADGPQVCELNSDTPSGEPEAVLLNRVVDGAGAAAFADPNCRLADRVFALLEDAASLQPGTLGGLALHSAPPRHPPAPALRAALPDPAAKDSARQASLRRRDRGPLTVGIVYPTELTDDLSVIELYARWFEARGARVVLGSPFNLHADGQGGVAMFGISCSVIWRHYKTDWWGERRTVWRSEDGYADDVPLVRQLALLAGAIARGKCAVVNPFGAVLTQNKRTMALLWEEIDRFAPWARAVIRRYLPFTARLEALPVARLRREKELWVLKSDYGCEGEEVVMGAEMSGAEWARVLDDAIPTRWIAQRRFVPRADAAGRIANYGVYVVAGQAAGIFTRLQAGHTDRAALCAPTMVSLQ